MRNWIIPEEVLPERTVRVWKREMRVSWVDADEKNSGIVFTIEREDGKILTYKADGQQLDVQIAALGGHTLREFFDSVGDNLLSLDPTAYIR